MWYEFFNLKPSFEDGIILLDETSRQIKIDCNDLSFKYPNSNNIVLKGIDLCIKPGEKIAIVGKNGAGKTTLMNILYGLYQQEEGEIFINGKKEDISSPLKAISIGIGMVHQHFMLARPLTVTENVMLGKKSRRGILLDTNQTSDELKALSDKYQMDIDPNSKIWQLSVGEQQRVGSAADGQRCRVDGAYRHCAAL